MIRSFNWRDFPTLHHHRKQGVCLDNSLLFTRSMTLIPLGALFSYLAPATGVYTYIATADENSKPTLIGQFTHSFGSPHAKLTFLTPHAALNSDNTLGLLDHLTQQAGSRGAHHLMAEVNDHSNAFVILRKAGFSVCARQSVWAVPHKSIEKNKVSSWIPATDQDEMAIRQLYISLVPALIQQVEPPPWKSISGVVYYYRNALLGYVQLSYGSQGILVQPLIHPNIEHVNQQLMELMTHLSTRRSRPIYMSVRSHQAWLELYLMEIGAQLQFRQAVMAKRLIVSQKAVFPIKLPITSLDMVQPEVSTTTWAKSQITS